MACPLQRMFEAPARSAASLCGTGEYALYSESVHSLSEDKTARKFLRVHVATGKTTEIPLEEHDSRLTWIEPTQNLIWHRRLGNVNELWVEEAGDRYCIGSTTSDSNLFQAVTLDKDDLGILLYSINVVSDSTSPHSTGKVFHTLPSITFDQGVGRTQGKLFFARATRNAPAHGVGSAKYTMGDLGPVDVLENSGLEWFPYSGAMPNISPPNCGISRSGIAFSATEKGLYQLGKFSSDPYFIAISDSPVRSGLSSRPTIIPTKGCDGWTGPPSLSADGESLAFVREGSHEKICIDRSIHIVHNLHRSLEGQILHLVDEAGQPSSLYPETLHWSKDKTSLYFTAVELGRQKLFMVDTRSNEAVPIQIAPRPGERGSVVAAQIAQGKDTCILTSSSFNSFNSLSILNLENGTQTALHGQEDPKFSDAHVAEAWFDSEGRQIRTHILHPSGFDQSKKYPVALFVHGGPFSTWADAYMSRWSMAAFAEQGYVVLTPDFTGSAGHSRDFRDAIWGDMGGKPYRDLEACMDFAERELPYADVDKAVCLGGSFGGYMVLWLAGQPLAKRFKALTSHAPAMFGATSLYATDIPDLWQKLAGGDHDDHQMLKMLDRWDPSRYANNWTTPIFLTHGQRDNRCPVSISMAAFTCCQLKGIESKLLVFPDESHFILRPGNAFHWYKEVIAWMDKFAKS